MSKGYNPYYDVTNRPLGKTPVRFSRTEVRHLGLAVAALTVGFALLDDWGTPVLVRVQNLFTEPIRLLASFLAVSSGFILHELAHKFVAIRYGCLAEFRAQMNGLGLAVIVALFGNILFAAPGAVQIYGRVDHKENGLISLAGPGTNILVAILALPLIVFTEGAAEFIFGRIGIVNAVLGAFNLLPFGPLDGKKIMSWNPVIWGASLVLAIGLAIASGFAEGLAL